MVKISSNVLAINAVAGSLLDDLFDNVPASQLENGAFSVTLGDETPLVIPAFPTLLPEGAHNPAPNAGSTHPVGFTLDGVPIRGVLAANNCDVTPIALKFSDECFKTLLPMIGMDSSMDMDMSTGMYFVPPMCLYDQLKTCESPETTVGYALDGFPIKMSADPDASQDLDNCGGGEDADGNYRYLFQDKFPYSVNCFRGELAMNLPMDDEFYFDGGKCEKLYDFAKTAREYVKKNNGGVALHDYLNYKTKDEQNNSTEPCFCCDKERCVAPDSEYSIAIRAGPERPRSHGRKDEKIVYVEKRKEKNKIAETLESLFADAREAVMEKLPKILEQSRERRSYDYYYEYDGPVPPAPAYDDSGDDPAPPAPAYDHSSSSAYKTTTRRPYSDTSPSTENWTSPEQNTTKAYGTTTTSPSYDTSPSTENWTSPEQNTPSSFSFDLMKEFPLEFAPFGFVKFQPFEYAADETNCTTIKSQRNLRADCVEDNQGIALNETDLGLLAESPKCLGFQGLYRKAIHCQNFLADVNMTVSYGPYNDDEVTFLPRSHQQNETCFRTDILGEIVEDSYANPEEITLEEYLVISSCPGNLVNLKSDKTTSFETCSRQEPVKLPLEFASSPKNVTLDEILGVSANLLNSCACPDGTVWSFLQNWCIPRSDCSPMEFEVPVPCELRKEVHEANGWYNLTCADEAEYFPKNCMVFNDIYNLCFEVDESGDIDINGRLDIVDMTAEVNDDGLEPGQWYTEWFPVTSRTVSDYYSSAVFHRTSASQYTYDFKYNHECLPVRAELYYPIESVVYGGDTELEIYEYCSTCTDGPQIYFHFWCEEKTDEERTQCDPAQMYRFACEDFPASNYTTEVSPTTDYHTEGSYYTSRPYYPTAGPYYPPYYYTESAITTIKQTMDALIWGHLAKYSCMEMFLLQRYHLDRWYSCKKSVENVYKQCLITSYTDTMGEEAASKLAEKEAWAVEMSFCTWTLKPMSLDEYFGYWDEGNVWELFTKKSSNGRNRRQTAVYETAPTVFDYVAGSADDELVMINYERPISENYDIDEYNYKPVHNPENLDTLLLVKIAAFIVEPNLGMLVTDHFVDISAASYANDDSFSSGMCNLWGKMQKSVDKAAKEGIKETIYSYEIDELLKTLNLSWTERESIKEAISVSGEIGLTWDAVSSLNPFCENKEQWPKLPEEINEVLNNRCEIPQAADLIVKCFNKYILDRVPHGDDYWRNILRFGICSYSQISRSCLGLPWVSADVEELYEETLDDIFYKEEEHVFNAAMITILDKIKTFPTEYDEFIHWSWAEAQRYLPEEITRQIEIYVGNPAEKLLRFIDDLEKGLLINKSGIERPIINCGTNALRFLKTILFEEEESLCTFMSSAIEDHKALLYQIHANYENFSRFCEFFVEKLVLMLEDEFLRDYASEMLMSWGSVPPIFITAGLNMLDTKTAYEIRKFSKWEKLECTYQAHWSEWSQCSETCDGGYRYRAQICMDKMKSQVSEILCGQEQLFSESEKCNTFECALPCSVSSSPPSLYDLETFKIDCNNRKLTVFPFSIEKGRIKIGERMYPARRIESFDFSNNYFDDSQWPAITEFIAQTHKTKEFNFAKNKFHTVPVSAIQKLTKNAELNLDGNEICKFDCEGFALREFSGRLNLCLTNNPIETIPFELVPAISFFNRFEFNDGTLGRNRTV